MSSPIELVDAIGRPAPVGTGESRLSPRLANQLAGQEGLEPPTAGFGDRDSSQLSYCPLCGTAGMRHQPDGVPPDEQVYVASHPCVERCRVLPGPARAARTRRGVSPASGQGMEGW